MSEDQRRIVIFDPSPIFTVTIESEEGRTPEVHFHLGGQGAWVGRTIGVLGGSPVLCGPIGGEAGAVLRALAEDERTGVPFRSVTCSRPNGGYVHDRRSGGRDVIVEVPAPALTRHEADDLYNLTLEECARADVLVLTGRRHQDVIPIGVYERLPRDAAALGCKVVADLDGKTAQTLGGPVDVLKLAHSALETKSDAGTRKAILTLRGNGSTNIVVSRNEEPTLALLDDAWFEVDPLEVEALEPRGAGDSMTGTLAHCIATGIPLERALRLATAAGATSVTRHGYATGLPATVQELADRVTIRAVG